jgi:hypothetical protein
MLALLLAALLASSHAGEMTWDDMGTVLTITYPDFEPLILSTPLPSVLTFSGCRVPPFFNI